MTMIDTTEAKPKVTWSYENDEAPETPDGYFLVEIYSIPEEPTKLKALVAELEASSGAESIVVMPDDEPGIRACISLDFREESVARACAVKWGNGNYSGPCWGGGMGEWRRVGVGDTTIRMPLDRNKSKITH